MAAAGQEDRKGRDAGRRCFGFLGAVLPLGRAGAYRVLMGMARQENHNFVCF